MRIFLCIAFFMIVSCSSTQSKNSTPNEKPEDTRAITAMVKNTLDGLQNSSVKAEDIDEDSLLQDRLKQYSNELLTPENIEQINWSDAKIGDKYAFNYIYSRIGSPRIITEDQLIRLIELKEGQYFFEKIVNGKKSTTIPMYQDGREYYKMFRPEYKSIYGKCDPFELGSCQKDEKNQLTISFADGVWYYENRKNGKVSFLRQSVYDKKGIRLYIKSTVYDRSGKPKGMTRTMRVAPQAVNLSAPSHEENLIGLWAMDPIKYPIKGVANVTEYKLDRSYRLYSFRCTGDAKFQRDPTNDSEGKWRIFGNQIITTVGNPDELEKLNIARKDLQEKIQRLSDKERNSYHDALSKDLKNITDGKTKEGIETIKFLSSQLMRSEQEWVNRKIISFSSKKVNSIKPNCVGYNP